MSLQKTAGTADAAAWLSGAVGDRRWLDLAHEMLLQLVEVDTTPKPQARACAAAEDVCFAAVERWLAGAAPAVTCERRPIRAGAIAAHPYFSRPYYLADLPAEPEAAARAGYEGRSNLVAHLPGEGPGLVFNAHIDTVPPHIVPRSEGDVLHGRGSADDKGGVAAIVLAAGLLEQARERFGVVPSCDLRMQFVIDEETGGNGSLSVTHEADQVCDAVVVLECTDLQPHPANRGAVWYRMAVGATNCNGTPKPNLLETAAFAVGAMEEEGRALRAESNHDMFPQRPVQTCHGMLGGFGTHPSRVHDFVPLRMTWSGVPHSLLVREVDAALADYIAAYGDKTIPGVGDALLAQHLAWRDVGTDEAVLDVFGLSGHMGATLRLDGAITKAMWIVRHLSRVARTKGGAWASVRCDLEGGTPDDLILEGGQGFLPTHELPEVTARMSDAARCGVATYEREAGLATGAVRLAMDFEKLHNAAFSRPADSTAMRAMVSALQAAGAPLRGAIAGWTVSCDARIFAERFPDADVVTFGPGALAVAHSAEERVDMHDVMRAAVALAHLALNFGRKASTTEGAQHP
ncbi:hypothetical protein CVU37_06005 [candidate division BRC1 bacterium HGW-BRC1-1]|jgi:acetylornithine deacetylase/succinyl-diaminopimelate desuccinylase-like protein|nr:MAG: hypothetical protein CVU37_06005 [candidate division BRC1 bacterium HGW-BRC1-1]